MSGSAPAGSNPPSSLGRGAVVAGAVLLSGLVRLYWTTRYAGWEESDYGNLAMIRGVLEGGFLHYDMNHMPGYYALGALVLGLVDGLVPNPTLVAARGVALVMGLIAVGSAVALADRLAGRRVALAAALLLAFQPELMLYSSSSLREPVYAGWVLASIAALCGERLVLAGIFAALAFSVRMDGALALLPALFVAGIGRGPRLPRLLALFGPLGAAIAAWSAYCAVEHGTPFFWSHSVGVNIETGLGAEAEGPLSWLAGGLSVVAGLLGHLLPWRVGWVVWAGALVALIGLPWARHDPRRTVGVLLISQLGVWAGIGLVGQHAPTHNLYWKWMMPIVPVLVPVGLAGLFALTDRWPRGRWLILGLGLAQIVRTDLRETARQVALGDQLYAPQRALAEWIEANVPASVPMVLDNIPSCYLNREVHERRLVSWFDVPSRPGDEADFARWLRDEQIGFVLWFAEDWTQAPRVAPFLTVGGTWEGEGLRLVERAREDHYGWIFFVVEPK